MSLLATRLRPHWETATKTKLALVALAISASLVVAASAQAQTVRCGRYWSGDPAYNVVGHNIRPIPNRLSGKKAGGCWVAFWVAFTQRDNWQYGKRHWKHYLKVVPHDATVSEIWHYTWRTRTDHPERGDRVTYFTARDGKQLVTFEISPTIACAIAAPAKKVYDHNGAGRIEPSQLRATNVPSNDPDGDPCHVANWLSYYIEYDWAYGPVDWSVSDSYGALPQQLALDPDGQTWRVSYSPSLKTAHTNLLRATLTHKRERVTVTLYFPDQDFSS